MAIARLWWADDSDIALTEGRIATLRNGQLSKWQWIRWLEPEDASKAFLTLHREITSKPMFEEGKVVTVHGLPSCHSEISNYLEDIPDGIVFIIRGGIAKNLKLYKAAKKLETQGLAKIDEPFKIDRTNVKQWAKERAIYYGGSIDDIAIKMLFDLVGPRTNLLDREIQKMLLMVDNKHITPFIVQEACFHEGDTDVFRLCSAIVQGNRAQAHEWMQRLLVKGENHYRMCGYLVDWSRKLAIAEDHGRNYDAIDKTKIESLQKLDRDEDDPLTISLEAFNNQETLTKQRLIANTGSLYYACKELSGSSKKKDWGLSVVSMVGTLILNLGEGKSPNEAFHSFVEEATSEEEEVVKDGE